MLTAGESEELTRTEAAEWEEINTILEDTTDAIEPTDRNAPYKYPYICNGCICLYHAHKDGTNNRGERNKQLRQRTRKREKRNGGVAEAATAAAQKRFGCLL